MNENKREFKLNFGNQEVIVESGRMAKQADGSVLVTSGKTQVLVTVCSAKEQKPGQDFFPLMVEYVEKFYAAGKFLGGFMKREARPTTAETLNARLIDRALRPLFPEGYMFDTIVSCTVVSYGEDGDPEVLASLGASAALSISDIPFDGPIGTCKVGKIDGNLVVNPHFTEWENSEFQLAVSASKDAILMVEGEANQHSEKEILDAILFAHEQIKEYCSLVETMKSEIGKEKRVFVPVDQNTVLTDKVKADYSSEARLALNIVDKLERQVAVKKIEHKVAEDAANSPADFGLTEDDSFGKHAYASVDGLLYDMLRTDILSEEKRIGGRGIDQVRQIETETDILKRTHGSSLFTRGETQVMATVTVGGKKGEQMVDRIVGQSFERFYLHYSFPPFSVGEARGKFNVGRRELGHGNLAERALKPVLPDAEAFPYTMRLACEVLESNGSSSMGSVCSGSMALMDAGVPLSSPVAGIAMGLVKENTDYKILTDILGDEDHLGDMDFKIAGTDKGITAIQMDIKIKGLSTEIMEEALERARVGRIHILGEMAKTISTERKELKEGVPKIETFNIKPDKIGALIGPGGKNIKALQEGYEVTIECDEDGTVKVIGEDSKKIEECITLCQMQINGPAVGSDYLAVVVTIKDYGAFVDLAPGVSGLVHISEFAEDRVSDPNEYVAEGDKIDVRVVEVDRMGRLKLSAKAVKSLEKKS
jgi:polyribonucleotide nucleotidyltransferase